VIFETMTSLFLSYDGLTDPLGQSQVLPYLIGLSKKGVSIKIISFEKFDRFEKSKTIIDEIVKQNNMDWYPQMYTKRPPVFSTIYDIWKMRNQTKALIKQYPIKIIHCRSYLPALIGLWAKKKYGLKFIFDMRGFWADERVEGKIWNLNNTLYKSIYNFFKKKEKQFNLESDAIVSLTHAGKKVLLNWFPTIADEKISVIPCCADIDFFDKNKLSISNRDDIRTELKLDNNTLLFIYSGGLGTWYCLDEMLLLFKKIWQKNNASRFLILTAENKSIVIDACKKLDIDFSKVTVRESSRANMPKYLDAADVALFFILPSFSKTASSPTKQGEMMAMQLPIICNSKVGDTAEIIKKYNAGWVIEEFTESNFEEIATSVTKEFSFDKNSIRNGAIEFYGLKNGIENYWNIYKKLNK